MGEGGKSKFESSKPERFSLVSRSDGDVGYEDILSLCIIRHGRCLNDMGKDLFYWDRDPIAKLGLIKASEKYDGAPIFSSKLWEGIKDSLMVLRNSTGTCKATAVSVTVFMDL